MKKMMQRLSLALVIGSTSALGAGSDSFQITPPPVPYPVFQQDRTDTKTTLNYTSMEGENLELSGAGVNVATRKITKKSNVAVDASFGLNVLSGDIGTNGELSIRTLNIQIGGEYQFKKEDKWSLIGFAGLSLPIFFGSTEISGSGFTSESDLFGLMYGLPFGVQAGFYPHEKWTITPFFMMNWILGGSVTTDTETTTNGNFTFNSTDTDIEGYMSPSYGFDVIYEPLKISAGGLLQVTKGGGSSGDIDTKVFHISWKTQI